MDPNKVKVDYPDFLKVPFFGTGEEGSVYDVKVPKKAAEMIAPTHNVPTNIDQPIGIGRNIDKLQSKSAITSDADVSKYFSGLLNKAVKEKLREQVLVKEMKDEEKVEILKKIEESESFNKVVYEKYISECLLPLLKDPKKIKESNESPTTVSFIIMIEGYRAALKESKKTDDKDKINLVVVEKLMAIQHLCNESSDSSTCIDNIRRKVNNLL